MVTKSRLFGGADTWSPNGAIPWGRNYENSLAWYEDAGVFLTPMYAYEIGKDDIDKMQFSAQLVGYRFDPQILDSFDISAQLVGWELIDLVKYTTLKLPADSLAIAGSLVNWELESLTLS